MALTWSHNPNLGAKPPLYVYIIYIYIFIYEGVPLPLERSGTLNIEIISYYLLGTLNTSAAMQEKRN